MTNGIRENENRITVSGFLVALFAFLAPLESFFATGIGSLLKFYSLGCIAVFVAEIFLKKRARGWHSELWVLIIFFAVMGLSVLWSEHMMRGVDVIFAIGLQVVFILTAATVPYTEREKKIILFAVGLSTLILSILLLTTVSVEDMELARQTVQTNGTDIDPNNIGALIVCGLAVLLPLKTENKWLSVIKFICEIVLIIACLYTASRGAAISMLVVFIYNIYSQKKLKNKVTSLFSVLIIAVAVYIVAMNFLAVNPFELLIDRFTEDSTGSDRTVLWKIALEAISERPFFGYGLGESPYIIGKTYVSNIGSHNTYLTIWFEGGIFAIALFLIFIFMLWKKKGNSNFDMCAFGTLAVSMVSSFFIDTYNKKLLWLPILLCVIAVQENQKNRRKKSPISVSA